MKHSLMYFVVVLAWLNVLSAAPFDQFGGHSPVPLEHLPNDPSAQVTVFQPNWLQPILPNTLPQPGEEKVKLQSCAALGEYECFVFALRSDRPTELGWNITPFASTNGEVIAPEWYELRVQRTLNTHRDVNGKAAITPLGLDLCEEIPLKAGETVVMVLDVKVPDDAKPGLYKTTITLTGLEQPIELPVTLRVLPFTLVRDTRSYGSYFLGRYLSDPNRSVLAYASPEMLERLCQAHRAYGFNSVQLCEVSPRMRYADGKVTADFSELETIVDAWRNAGNNGLVSIDIRFPGWWCDELSVILENRYSNEPTRYTVEELEALYPSLNAVEHNLKVRWSKDYRLSELGKELYRQFCTQILDLIRSHGWQDIYLCVDEEAGNGGLKLWDIEQFGPVLAEFPEAKILLYDNSPYLGVDLGHRFREWIQIRQYNFISEELVATAKADGIPLWYYNRGWNRACFGFPVWKLGAGGVHMWADQWCDVPPYGQNQNQYPVWTVFYPSPDGPMPTLEGIRAREGIDDLGYLDTLVDRIEKLTAAGKSEATECARRHLEQLRERLPLSNQEFNDYRKGMTVEGAFAERWKLASEILRLDKEAANDAQ